jgi:hypothetical protein
MTIRLNTKKKTTKTSSGMFVHDQTPGTMMHDSIDGNNYFEQRPMFLM